MALHRQLVGAICLLALPPLGCGRAVPLGDALDGGPLPDASVSVASLPDASVSVATLPPCDEGRWRCAGELCRLVGGNEGLPPAGDDWICEQELAIDKDDHWCCGCPAQWVCHGRLDAAQVPAVRACGWHCAPDNDRFPDEQRCTREVTDRDTPPGAVRYPLCKCMQPLDGSRVHCALCKKRSELGTVCRVDTG